MIIVGLIVQRVPDSAREMVKGNDPRVEGGSFLLVYPGQVFLLDRVPEQCLGVQVAYLLVGHVFKLRMDALRGGSRGIISRRKSRSRLLAAAIFDCLYEIVVRSGVWAFQWGEGYGRAGRCGRG